MVATVLTVYGIETITSAPFRAPKSKVATVLTVYGIETYAIFLSANNLLLLLQQYLPFTVLKLDNGLYNYTVIY